MVVSGLSSGFGEGESGVILGLMVGDVWREEGWSLEGLKDKGSRLGHCTGLLLVDVAAHTTSVHAWRKHTAVGVREVRGEGGGT